MRCELSAWLRRMTLCLLLAAAGGCQTAADKARVFQPWLCENEQEFRARVAQYRHVLLVCLYEDYWEDQGPNRYALYHSKATVVKVFKGGHRMGERLAFVEGLDYRAPTNPKSAAGTLLFVFTNQEGDEEVALEAGDTWRCQEEYLPAMECVFGRWRW